MVRRRPQPVPGALRSALSLNPSAPRRSIFTAQAGDTQSRGDRLSPRALACILTALAAASFGCGRSAEPGGVVEVVFWHAMGGPLGDVLEDTLIAEFNATHPGIRVIPVSMGNYRALSQKIMAAAMAGEPPALAQAYETWTAQLIRGGAIVPLDSMMDLSPAFRDSIWPDMFDVFRRDNTFGGRIYSLPFNKSVPLVYYNADLFDSLGLSPAETWEEQRELLGRLCLDSNGDGDLLDEGDRWGAGITVSVWTFECLLAQAGGSLLSEDGTETAFDSPMGIEALSYLESLLHEDRSVFLASGFEHQRAFSERRTGLVEGSVTSLAYLLEDMERRAESGLPTFRIGVAPLPAGREHAVFIAGTNVVVFRSDDPRRVAAAWEFATWFLEPRQQARWFAGSGYLPAVRSALREPEALEKIERHPGLERVIGQLEYARFEPQTTAWYDGREFLSEAVEIVLYGRMSPEEALERAARLTDEEMRLDARSDRMEVE